MPHLGEADAGRKIDQAIGRLVKKGLPEQVQQSLDFCLFVGHSGAHPGLLDLTADPDLVLQSFDLINFVIEDQISRPQRAREMFEKLPEEQRKKIEQRDKAAKP